VAIGFQTACLAELPDLTMAEASILLKKSSADLDRRTQAGTLFSSFCPLEQRENQTKRDLVVTLFLPLECYFALLFRGIWSLTCTPVYIHFTASARVCSFTSNIRMKSALSIGKEVVSLTSTVDL
jgi:hypothetical protein